MFSILNSNLVNPFEPIGEKLKQELDETISYALAENKSGTLFINSDQLVTIEIIAEEDCILCGAPWVDGVLEKIQFTGKIEWYAVEGSKLLAGDKVCTIYSAAKDMLGKEKVIIDFLCLFSSISTWMSTYAELVCDTATLLYCDYLTIPGLSLSQQYAVRVGGGDGYYHFSDEECLISKNYIRLAGGVSAALQHALGQHSLDVIKVEVVSFQELMEAIEFGIQHVILCFFPLEQIAKAQEQVKGRAFLEVYGGVHLGNIREIAQMGITKIIIDNFANDIHVVHYSLSY